MVEFWERVEELRKALGMTQREMSTESGFIKTKVEAWLARNPQPIPKGADCVALARTLGTSVEYLVTGEEVDDEDEQEIGEANGMRVSDDPVLKAIADDPDLYRAAQLISADKRKALAVLAFAGEKPLDSYKAVTDESRVNKKQA